MHLNNKTTPHAQKHEDIVTLVLVSCRSAAEGTTRTSMQDTLSDQLKQLQQLSKL